MLESAPLAITEHTAAEPLATESINWLFIGGLVWLLALGLKGISAKEKAWRIALLSVATILTGLLLSRQGFLFGFIYVNAGFLLAVILVVRKLWRIRKKGATGA